MGYSVAGIRRGVALELHALFLRVEYATVIVITSVIPAVVEKPGSVILAIPPRVVSVDRWFVTNFRAQITAGTGMDVVTVNFLRTLRFDPRIFRTIKSPYRAHVPSDRKRGKDKESFTRKRRLTAAHVHEE